MYNQRYNFADLFETVHELFSPRVVAEVNDVYVKIAKVKGDDVPWHTHAHEDEMFYVFKGALTMKVREQPPVVLGTGDFFVVRKGVEHTIDSAEECWIVLIENKTTQHTGDVDSAITKSVQEQLNG